MHVRLETAPPTFSRAESPGKRPARPLPPSPSLAAGGDAEVQLLLRLTLLPIGSAVAPGRSHTYREPVSTQKPTHEAPENLQATRMSFNNEGTNHGSCTEWNSARGRHEPSPGKPGLCRHLQQLHSFDPVRPALEKAWVRDQGGAGGGQRVPEERGRREGEELELGRFPGRESTLCDTCRGRCLASSLHQEMDVSGTVNLNVC